MAAPRRLRVAVSGQEAGAAPRAATVRLSCGSTVGAALAGTANSSIDNRPAPQRASFLIRTNSQLDRICTRRAPLPQRLDRKIRLRRTGRAARGCDGCHMTIIALV